MTAVCNCKLLCIEMDSLGLLVSSRPELQVALARLMAEAPAPDQVCAATAVCDRHDDRTAGPRLTQRSLAPGRGGVQHFCAVAPEPLALRPLGSIGGGAGPGS